MEVDEIISIQERGKGRYGEREKEENMMGKDKYETCVEFYTLFGVFYTRKTKDK